MNRKSWNEFYMDLCFTIAERSTCTRRKVGAVLVKDKRIIATGFNGAPTNLNHCDITGCLREKLGVKSGTCHEICRGSHAEENAIVQCAKYGIPTKGATLYCVNSPCSICAKMIINAGIEKIFFAEHYPDENALKLLYASPDLTMEQV